MQPIEIPENLLLTAARHAGPDPFLKSRHLVLAIADNGEIVRPSDKVVRLKANLRFASGGGLPIETLHVSQDAIRAMQSSAPNGTVELNCLWETLINGHYPEDPLLDCALQEFRNPVRPEPRGPRFGPSPVAASSFLRNLTEEARQGNLEPMIGRQVELANVIRILSRRTKNNPVLVGEPGVGKTAIAEGLAQLIASGQAPRPLWGTKVMAVDVVKIMGGAVWQGEMEERIKNLLNEIAQSGPSSILFIDELHALFGRALNASSSVSDILKPALARGLRCIGATTLDEYHKHIEKDPALARRFQKVWVGEPNAADSIQILRGLKESYETHHGVSIGEDVLEAAVSLSTRFIGDRFLPDKAIDLLDEAATRVSLRADIRSAKNISARVTATDIAEVVSEKTGIPISIVNGTGEIKFDDIAAKLREKVRGQNGAVEVVARALQRGLSGLADPKRPIASFLFTGPTGVGKSELAKAVADCFFGGEKAMVRLDMSEFGEKHSVLRLVGAPPLTSATAKGAN